MKAKGVAGGLLPTLYPLWLAATTPARLLVSISPSGTQAGSLSSSVQCDAVQPVYWHGGWLERLTWSLTLVGWQASPNDPHGVEDQTRLWGPRDPRLQERRLITLANLLGC